MSDIQLVMKFELLPNEILIECFEYLNALQILYSFDQLNYRFNKLIQNIPLYLDFQYIPKLLFNQFCMKILSNQEIKKQIYSLHLSNKNTYWQIPSFLSFFSLEEFPHLQSLTLTEVRKDDVSQLKSMLPLISQLSCFCLIDSVHGTDRIFSALPKSQLRTLKMSHLPDDLKYIYKLSSITNVTISGCPLSILYQLLSDAPLLKYLSVQDMTTYRSNSPKKETYSIAGYATNLKKLIYKGTLVEFSVIEMLIKETPNLRSLTIDAIQNDRDMIDACKWEQMITSSLPYLNIFKFKFECTVKNENNFIEEKFKQFQGDFWCKQHHWYTEYSLSKYGYIIYTIPYMFDTYKLISYTKRYCNQLIKNSNKFNNVTNLIIDPDAVREKSQYHFSSVTSMTLESYWKAKHIKSLKMINLSNLKDLVISSHRILETPSILLELLKQTPKLSSITLNLDILISLFDDDELCEYLNKMITKLHIIHDYRYSSNNSHNLNQFCEIFSNIEQLTCNIEELDYLLYLLKHLSKLEHLKLYSMTDNFGFKISRLEEESQKLGLKIITNLTITSHAVLSICIIRDMY